MVKWSSIEENDPKLILRRAYYHIALRCIEPCGHAVFPSKRCLMERSRYQLTLQELLEVERLIIGRLEEVYAERS